jgi:hypothetical protein
LAAAELIKVTTRRRFPAPPARPGIVVSFRSSRERRCVASMESVSEWGWAGN